MRHRFKARVFLIGAYFFWENPLEINVLYWTLCVYIWDLNECTSGVHNCHDLGVCTNNVGSFTCHCQRGYTGNGMWCAGNVVVIFCIFTLPVWDVSLPLVDNPNISCRIFICNNWLSILKCPQLASYVRKVTSCTQSWLPNWSCIYRGIFKYLVIYSTLCHSKALQNYSPGTNIVFAHF